MADATVQLSTEGSGKFMDNEVVATSLTTAAYRERVVIAGASSGGVGGASIAPVQSTAPATADYGLYVRPIGSSGTVLASVAPSSTWTVTLSSGLAASTGAIGVLGSASGTVIGSVAPSSNWSLGASSAVVVGLVGVSSAVTLSSGIASIGVLGSASGTVIGSVAPSSTWSIAGASAAIELGYVFLSSGTTGERGSTATPLIGLVAPSSTWTVTPTSGALVVLSSGLAQFGVLGPSSGNVIGSVAPSSTWTVLASQNPPWSFGSTAGSVIGGSTVNLIGAVGGQVLSGIAQVVAQSSGLLQPFLTDRMGLLVTNAEGSRALINAGAGVAGTVLTADTSQTQFIAAQGANVVADLLAITLYSTALTNATNFMIFSSCGQAEPGVWSGTVINSVQAYTFAFPTPLPQPTANNAWFVVSTSSATPVRIHAQYVVKSS